VSSSSLGVYPTADAATIDVVALDDHRAEIDPDAQFDAVLRRDARIPLGHRLLHLDRATHRIDDAREFHQHAVAGGLDDVLPWCSAIFGSTGSRRSDLRRSSVSSSPRPLAASTTPHRRRGSR
jgi:hypothetical protein